MSVAVDDQVSAVAIHHFGEPRSAEIRINFCRVHQTLRVTHAMEAGLADHVWSWSELVGLLEQKADNVAA